MHYSQTDFENPKEDRRKTHMSCGKCGKKTKKKAAKKKKATKKKKKK
jgi:formate dehydrogenase assembly factor FdhD